MTRSLFLLPLLALAACDKPAAPTPKAIISKTDDLAAQLAAQPRELADLRRRCRAEPELVGADTCRTVARATRIRLMKSSSAYAPGVASNG